MAAEITLTKSDESPWGFRLTGGRDFGTPLTIIKVSVGSVAEEAGLQIGDILVKINDVDCHLLTHKEAQDLIIGSNNSVTFALLRGSLALPEEVIDRLTPLPLRDFKTPEPIHPQQQLIPEAPAEPTALPSVEIIPIQDLEPDILEELGLNPLPEDFLEKAKRDPSPMPEVRPLSRMADAPDVLETLEQMGLHNVVQDIERQKEVVFAPVPEPVVCEPAVQQIEEPTAETPVAEVTPALPEGHEPAVLLPEISEELTKAIPLEVSMEDVQAGLEQNFVAPVTESEFSEFISGQEEVLQAADGKTALGVDFKKFEPREDFIRKSQVFQTLQENDRPVSREEKDRRWTTFLDKPKRPKPKPKPKQVELPVEVKPEPIPEPELSHEPHQLYEIPSKEEFEALVRVPTPPIAQQSEQDEPSEEPRTDEIEESEPINDVTQQLLDEQENLQQRLQQERESNTGEEKSEIEIQLEEIQRQLQAIQQLPFEIQQHLALVQDQLNKIVQHRLHEQDGEIPAGPRPSMVEENGLLDHIQEVSALPPVEETPQEVSEEIPTNLEDEQSEEQPPAEILSTEKPFKLRAEEEPAILPPPKKEKPQKKRPFLGLGPAPRPLVLPGGRKWRTPKDAYNDEFIAETLSAQAEIITGTTLGVNFRRYEPKPANLSHLRESFAYKMIHDLEDPNIAAKGLATRPEIVPSLQDYSQLSAPAAL